MTACTTNTRIPTAWGDFLRQFAWTHYVTLTSKDLVTPERLVRKFLQTFVRGLASATQDAVPYFYAIEPHVRSDAPHLHALVGGTDAVTVRQLERWWDLGFTRIAPYDATRGGAYYVSKLVDRFPDHYGLSRRLPTRSPSRQPALVIGLPGGEGESLSPPIDFARSSRTLPPRADACHRGRVA